MGAFELVEKLSFFDEDGNDVVSINDAIYCMKQVIEEIKNTHSSLNTEDFNNYLKNLKSR